MAAAEDPLITEAEELIDKAITLGKEEVIRELPEELLMPREREMEFEPLKRHFIENLKSRLALALQEEIVKNMFKTITERTDQILRDQQLHFQEGLNTRKMLKSSVDELKLDIKERDQVMKALNKEIADKTKGINAMEKEIADKNKEIADKNKEIAEKNMKINANENVIADKDKEIAEKNMEINANEKVIADKDKGIKQIEEELRRCKEKLKKQDQDLQEKEQAIKKQKKDINDLQNGVYRFNDEKINYVRIMHAMTNVGGAALRTILKQNVLYPNVMAAINANLSRLTLGSQPLLSKDQQETVQKPGATEKDFDIALLYTLIRNISQVKKHKNGWGKPPEENPRDTSLGASVERLRFLRNTLVGHMTSPTLSHGQFMAMWQQVAACIKDIDVEVRSPPTFEEQLNTILNQQLGHNEVQTILEGFQSHMEKDLKEIKDELEQARADQKDQTESLQGSLEKIMSGEDKTVKIIDSIHEHSSAIKSKVQRLEDDLDKVLKDIKELEKCNYDQKANTDVFMKNIEESLEIVQKVEKDINQLHGDYEAGRKRVTADLTEKTDMLRKELDRVHNTLLEERKEATSDRKEKGTAIDNIKGSTRSTLENMSKIQEDLMKIHNDVAKGKADSLADIKIHMRSIQQNLENLAQDSRETESM